MSESVSESVSQSVSQSVSKSVSESVSLRINQDFLGAFIGCQTVYHHITKSLWYSSLYLVSECPGWYVL